MVVSTFHTHDTTSIFSSIFDAYPISEKGIIADKLKNYFKCFVSQRLIPRADKTGVMPVFEILKNIPVIR
jgi:Tfp pilus assembly pilus retraction ATPase PilT